MADATPALRALVRHRAADRCEYCRLPQSAEPLVTFHLEHVVARQHGGPTAAANLAWACQYCNRHKGPNLAGVDSVSGTVVSLFNPRTDRWADHFTSGPAGVVVGTTPCGRATVDVLAMNAAGRPQLRAVNG